MHVRPAAQRSPVPQVSLIPGAAPPDAAGASDDGSAGFVGGVTGVCVGVVGAGPCAAGGVDGEPAVLVGAPVAVVGETPGAAGVTGGGEVVEGALPEAPLSGAAICGAPAGFCVPLWVAPTVSPDPDPVAT